MSQEIAESGDNERLPEIPDDEVVRRLVNRGFAEDEINTLYPTARDRLAFYHGVVRNARRMQNEGDDDGAGDWPEDNYQPTKLQKKESAALEKQAKELASKQKKAVQEAKSEITKKKHELLQKELPADATVTAEEFAQAGRDLRSLLSGMDPEPVQKAKKKKNK